MDLEGPAPEAAPRKAARRLFFALWPDEVMRQALVHATREAVRASGGRPVPADNLHVTLAFLGSVPDGLRGEIAEIARAVGSSTELPGGRLEIAFEHLEYWRPAQILCALAAEPPAPLIALGRKLQDRLAARRFTPDLAISRSGGNDAPSPFRPHVTLARKVHRPPRALSTAPVLWSFTGFVLVDSKTLPEGAVYTVLEKFRLAH